MHSKLPQSFLSVGRGTQSQARSKILTLHTARGSRHVSFENKVPLFPLSLCRWWQSLLHSSFWMLWWLLPAGPLLALKRCSKDQNNKIKWQQNAMVPLSDARVVASRWGVSQGELCEWCLLLGDRVGGSSGTEDLSMQHTPNLKEGMSLPRTAGGTRELGGFPWRALASHREPSPPAIQAIKYLFLGEVHTGKPQHPLRSLTPMEGPISFSPGINQERRTRMGTC